MGVGVGWGQLGLGEGEGVGIGGAVDWPPGVRALLRGLRRQSLGQHGLQEPQVLRRVVGVADTVLLLLLLLLLLLVLVEGRGSLGNPCRGSDRRLRQRFRRQRLHVVGCHGNLPGPSSFRRRLPLHCGGFPPGGLGGFLPLGHAGGRLGA